METNFKSSHYVINFLNKITKTFTEYTRQQREEKQNKKDSPHHANGGTDAFKHVPTTESILLSSCSFYFITTNWNLKFQTTKAEQPLGSLFNKKALNRECKTYWLSVISGSIGSERRDRSKWKQTRNSWEEGDPHGHDHKVFCQTSNKCWLWETLLALIMREEIW